MLTLTGKLKKTISVDEKFVEISQKSLLQGTNSKKIPINRISSVEVKKPDWITTGYIQIAEIGSNQNKSFTTGAYQAALDENSVLFQSSSDYETALKIKEFIETQMANESSGKTVIQNQVSAADEILKLKSLLESGILTQEEFDAKKKQLLNI